MRYHRKRDFQLSMHQKPSVGRSATSQATTSAAGTAVPSYRPAVNWAINQLVRLHVKASPGHDPITSRHNSTRHPVTSVLLGEWHSSCCRADRRLCTTTLSARSWSRRSASSSSTRSDASATSRPLCSRQAVARLPSVSTLDLSCHLSNQ